VVVVVLALRRRLLLRRAAQLVGDRRRPLPRPPHSRKDMGLTPSGQTLQYRGRNNSLDTHHTGKLLVQSREGREARTPLGYFHSYECHCGSVTLPP
jgi:hypothetical protein